MKPVPSSSAGSNSTERSALIKTRSAARSASNAATYTWIYDHLREFFAALPEARVRGYKPDRFSFNMRGGRCEACAGEGVTRLEMYFIPELFVTCPVCRGALQPRNFGRQVQRFEHR